MPAGIEHIHPIARLNISLTEIEKRTGVCRPNLWKVVHGERDSMSVASLRAIKEAYPAFDLETAVTWQWSQHPKPKKTRRSAA